MLLKVKYIPLLIFFVFSLNLLSEINAFHFEGPISHAVTLALNVNGDGTTTDSYQNEKPQSENENSKHKDCADPCHRGQCHFGHCVYHLIPESLTLSADLFKLSYIDFEFLVPTSPFLKQAKQPPRFS